MLVVRKTISECLRAYQQAQVEQESCVWWGLQHPQKLEVSFCSRQDQLEQAKQCQKRAAYVNLWVHTQARPG